MKRTRTTHDYWTPAQLKRWQKKAGLTDNEAAAAIGLQSGAYLRRLKRGEVKINKRVAQSALLALVIKGTYEELLGPEAEQEAEKMAA